ncbi:MAG: type II secretion system F family protein [Armatimonadetes bacterium]|nr:type II secretion system F family protein [Armatimonadota bacterium]
MAHQSSNRSGNAGQAGSRDPKHGWEAKVTVPPLRVATFTKQLAIMLRNGIPIMQALATLSHQEEYPNFGVVVSSLADRLGRGHSLSRSVAEFPRVFPPLFSAMMDLGESTGRLTESLDRLGDWLERDGDFFRRVKSAAVYPAFVVAVSALLTLALFYTVLPQFVQIFIGMGIQLPVITRVMIFLTDLVRNPGFWMLLGVLGCAGWIGLRRAWARPAGACAIFRILLRLPLAGRLLSYASTARFASAAEISLDTGLDLARTLELGARASGSPLILADAAQIVKSLTQGLQVSEHLGLRAGIYAPALAHFVRAGEEAGDLGIMLKKAASFYEEEVNHMIDTLSAVLEPFLLLGVAGIVGTVLLSVFLPMYSYLGQLGP